MRRLLVLALVAGCGRIGFEERGDGGGSSGSADAPGNPLCGSRERPTVAMGAQSTCVVRLDGSWWCAGIGFGPQFKRVDMSNRYLRVDAEEAAYCALDLDCQLSCFGDNVNGELGTGDTTPRATPTVVTPGVRYRDVGAGGFHTCAIREDNALMCWGRNLEGELGLGDTMDRHTPERVGSATWKRVVRGYLFTCAFDTADELWCWGDNDSGQLGLGPGAVGTTSPAPVLVPTQGRAWLAASAGKQHTCALDTDHALWCWGLNMMGQVGRGDLITPVPSPVRIGGSTAWVELAAGRFITCATQTDRSLWCWGENQFGTVGVPGMTLQSSPVRIAAPSMWSAISPGNVAMCAFDDAGDLYCWGENSSGQLGLGDTQNRTVPTKVTFP
jgi:alpha-tubulin suppressor-like RCC1 family protein